MNADAPHTSGSGRFRLELVGWMAEALSCGEEAAALRPEQVPVLPGLRLALSLSSKFPFPCRPSDLSQSPSLAFLSPQQSLSSLPALWTCCPDTKVKRQPHRLGPCGPFLASALE